MCIYTTGERGSKVDDKAELDRAVNKEIGSSTPKVCYMSERKENESEGSERDRQSRKYQPCSKKKRKGAMRKRN